PEVGPERISIPLRDRQAELEVPLQDDLYAGTGGLEGTADLTDKPRPVALGDVRNVPAVLVDPARLIYQVADSEIEALTVYDRGIELGTNAGGTWTDPSAVFGTSAVYAILYANGVWHAAGADGKYAR